MALSPAIIGLISTAATNKRVQDIAGDLATKAYGKLFGDPAQPALLEAGTSADDEFERLRTDIQELPTKDEFVASFALLEARFAIEQQKSAKMLRVLLASQLIAIALLTGVLVR